MMERMLSIVQARRLMIERWGRYISVRTLARWCEDGTIYEAQKVTPQAWGIPESCLERVAMTVGRGAPKKP